MPTTIERHTGSQLKYKLPALAALAGLFVSASASGTAIDKYGMVTPDGVRHYIVVTPDGPGNAKHPAIVLLHGHGASAAWFTGQDSFAGFRTNEWLQLAEREHVLLIIPDGAKGSDGEQAWNDCRADAETNSTTNDVRFISALIDTAISQHGADPDRVYAFGQSNGGGMVYRLGIEIPQKLAAIGVQSALMPAHSRCALPSHPLPVFITHGTDDKIAPYSGGEVSHWALRGRGSGVSIEESVAIWRKIGGLPEQASTYRFPHLDEKDSTSATRYTWGNSSTGLQVEFLKIEGGGHTWPSRSVSMPWLVRKLLGEMNHDVELTTELWSFFKDKRLNH